MFPVLLTPADSLPRKHPTLLLTRASWRPPLIFLYIFFHLWNAPLEKTFVFSNTVIFHIQQEVIALISAWPQIFLSGICNERNTDKTFTYFFSGLLQWLTIFGSLSPIIQEFRKTQHNWYGTLGSYFKNGPHSKALKTLFLSKNEKKELWIVLALNMFMHYNHKRDFKGQCPTIQLWKKGHGYTKRGGEQGRWRKTQTSGEMERKGEREK